MKNLLIYISPDHCLLPEYEKLAKIQIDNSLELGWKKEDMMFVSNFPYEYNGVKSILVGDHNICPFYMYSGKINTFVDMYEKGMIDYAWYHDFDAFQNAPFEEPVFKEDVGFTDYGRKLNWNGGSSFLKKEAKDIFVWMRDWIYRDPDSQPIQNHIRAYNTYSDEVSLKRLTDINYKNINDRIKRMDISYNFNLNTETIRKCYEKALKPIKVFHFHRDKIPKVMGRNELRKVLLSERLINLFNKYGYTPTDN